MRRRSSLLIACAAASWLTGTAPLEAQVLGENSLGYPIRIFAVSLTNGTTYQFTTSPNDSLSQPGGGYGDTVMSLVDWDFVSAPTTLAGADGCNSSSGYHLGPSCFSYTHNEPSGTYFVILRAWREHTPAYVPWLLYKANGAPFWTTIAQHVSVGGGTEHVSNTSTARRHLHTAHQPGRADDHIILVSRTNEWDILYAGYENGRIGETAKWDVVTTFGYPSSLRVSFGGDESQYQGNARLLDNDWYFAGEDFDGDGLSRSLEADVGSCDRSTDVLPSGFQCSTLEFCNTDPSGDMCKARLRDTDNDGLRDDLEVYGFDDGTTVEKFPRWGATPDHKDMFIEIDVYDRDTVTDTLCEGLSAPGSQDEFDPELLGFGILPESHFFDRFEDIYAQMPADWNPDGIPGLRAHHDVGVANPDPLDTRWGDYGGGNDCFFFQDGMGGVCAYPEAAFGTDPSVCGTSTPGFAPARRWLYRYVVDGLGPTGGQGGGLVAGANGLTGHVHEVGHLLEIFHEGPRHTAGFGEWSANRRPLYPSRINYRFQDYGGLTAEQAGVNWSDIAFSFGEWDRQTNARSVGEIAPVPGEVLEPLENGSPAETVRFASGDWDVDWNDDGTYQSADTHMAKFRETVNGRLARWHHLDKSQLGMEAFGSHHDLAVANGTLAYAYVRYESGAKRVFVRGDGDGDCSVLPEDMGDGLFDYTTCLTMGWDYSPSTMAADGVSISPAFLNGPGLTEGLVMVWRSGQYLHWREVDVAPSTPGSSADIGASFSNGGLLGVASGGLGPGAGSTSERRDLDGL